MAVTWLLLFATMLFLYKQPTDVSEQTEENNSENDDNDGVDSDCFADQVDLDKQTDNFTEHDIRKYEACEI